MSISARTTEFLLATIGEIDSADDLYRIIRKSKRTLRKIGAAEPTAPARPLKIQEVKAGQTIIMGTPNGEHTKVRVLKVNRKRVKVETLESRGKKKSYAKGTVFDVYPNMLRARA